MAKVLWIADGGCHTGFGRVTHALGERLVQDYGHDITVLAANYNGDFWPGLRDPNVQPLKLYTTTGPLITRDIYGSARILEMLARVEPEVVVMLNDPQVLLQLLFENRFDPGKWLMQRQPLIFYLACDGTNLPPPWTSFLPQIGDVIAMSKWGAQNYKPSELAYHGIDADEWWPVEERPIVTSDGTVCRTKDDCKKAFGYEPGDFLIGRVDTNSGRKDFSATWKALVPVMKQHKNVKAHFHCSNRSSPAVVFDVLFTREPTVADRFFLPQRKNDFEGWAQRDLNALVNAFDLVVNTSRGEGFGFSNAEALACGVPVIAQNVSAIPEVVGPGGILIEPHGLITVPSGEDNWLADIPAFTQATLELIESPTRLQELGRKGLEHVRSSFSWEATAAIFDAHIDGNAEGYHQMLAEQAAAKEVSS